MVQSGTAKEVDVASFRMPFGILLGCGLHPRELIDVYSLEEIALLAGLVMEQRVSMLNMLAEPLIQAMGGEFKPAAMEGLDSKPNGKPKRKTPKKNRFSSSTKKTSTAPEERTLVLSEVPEEGRDAALLMALTRAGSFGMRGSGISMVSKKVADTE